VLGAYDIKTGERRYEHRLGNGSGGFTASVVAGDDKIYFTAELGEVYVVKPGPEFELLATNEMDEICMATPAIARGTLYYRTRGHLVALAAK
jgi:outer membrane protein assembly factor BamB